MKGKIVPKNCENVRMQILQYAMLHLWNCGIRRMRRKRRTPPTFKKLMCASCVWWRPRACGCETKDVNDGEETSLSLNKTLVSSAHQSRWAGGSFVLLPDSFYSHSLCTFVINVCIFCFPRLITDRVCGQFKTSHFTVLWSEHLAQQAITGRPMRAASISVKWR